MTALSEADTSFVQARPRLFGIARRVLGSATDADDIVQEAWMRWQETDRSQVRDPAAFLATTTTRLALNVGQSARVRHETDFGPPLAEAGRPGRRSRVSAPSAREAARARPVDAARAAVRRPSAPSTCSGRRSTTRTGGSRRSSGSARPTPGSSSRAPAAGSRASRAGRSMPPSTPRWSRRSSPPRGRRPRAAGSGARGPACGVTRFPASARRTSSRVRAPASCRRRAGRSTRSSAAAARRCCCCTATPSRR